MTVGQLLANVVPWLLYACALFALRLWWRNRSRPAMWLALSFLSIGLLLLLSEIAGDDLDGVAFRALIILIVAFPYFLARFADSITKFDRRLRWATHAIFAVGVVSLSSIHPNAEADPAAWVIPVFIGVWAGLLGIASFSLFFHGRGRSTIVRRRLRLMAAGSLMMGLALIPSVMGDQQTQETGQDATAEESATEETGQDATAEESATEETGQDTTAEEPAQEEADPNSVQSIISNSLVSVSAILFLLGFAPPKALRTSWRREDEEQLYNAAIAFMAAEDPDAVTRDIVPRIKDVLGSPGVAILDDGEVIARAGTHVAPGMSSVREIRMGQHMLLVQTDPSMPLLNEGDTEFVSRLGVLADLALERARLMQAEKEAKTDLEAVNSELESFVYTTSHDLKNPIIAMLGYIDLLKTEYSEGLPAEAQRFIDRMQANAAYMEALIRDLLELSRVGRVEVEPDLVDLESLVDGVADDVTNRFTEVTVTRSDLPDLWINPTRARQLFGNLIENAAKYGGDGVAIEVSAEQGDHGWWHVTVSDNGKGIPQEYLERVFGVFERLDANKDGGTGMGLAICRRIVEQAGGHIHAVPSDSGARFQIDLPASAVPTAPLLAEDEEGVLQ